MYSNSIQYPTKVMIEPILKINNIALAHFIFMLILYFNLIEIPKTENYFVTELLTSQTTNYIFNIESPQSTYASINFSL